MIPGGICGIILASWFSSGLQTILEKSLRRSIIMNFPLSAILVGILVAGLLPLVAMIAPVINGLSI